MSCHRVIDPIGLALENFDVTGQYRIKDNGVPVDSTGQLYDGTEMEGAAGLRNALLKHQDAFLMTFAENLMTYALGRQRRGVRHAGAARDRPQRRSAELPACRRLSPASRKAPRFK